MKIETSITINVPREEVFRVFTDLETIAERVSGIRHIEVLEKSPHMEVGTKWRETRVMFGKEATEVMWVTELVADTRYVVEARSHGMHYVSTYHFEPASEGTRVQMEFAGTPVQLTAKLMAWLFVFFAAATKKALYQDLVDLKQALEQDN